MRGFFCTTACVAALGIATAGFCAQAGRKAAVFATERVSGKWSKSFFSSVSNGSMEPGVCEEVLFEAFSSAGFALPAPPFTEEGLLEARRLRTVFERYYDVGSIPNDTAVRAASAIMPGAGLVVLCGANSSYRRARKGRPAAVCAAVACRAIDVGSKHRVATSVGESCSGSPDRNEAGAAAVKEACREAGATIAHNLAGR